ncbi:hypothetical protein ACOSQ2_026207 [Xanthoceras sorbifolium]
MPLLEVILAADVRCAKCQDKVADAISRVGDVEAMEVHLLKKKVILTSKSTNKESPINTTTCSLPHKA